MSSTVETGVDKSGRQNRPFSNDEIRKTRQTGTDIESPDKPGEQSSRS